MTGIDAEGRPAAGDEKQRAAEGRLLKAAKLDLTPRELVGRMAGYVAGQDDALRTLSVVAVQHLTARVRRLASTLPPVQPTRIQPLLLVGSPGTGKTTALRALGRLLGLPHHIADASRLTAEGWQGLGLADVLQPLMTQADDFAPLAVGGILCLDEIDKKKRSDMLAYGGRDISGGDAQDVLLRLLDGGVVQYDVYGGANGSVRSTRAFTCEHLLILAAGAFDGIEEVVLSRIRGKKRIGFGAGDDRGPDELSASELRRLITHEDVRTYGLKREICSRFGRIVIFNDLDRRAMRRILVETPEGAIQAVQALARPQGFRFEFPPALIETILDRCGGDARGLSRLVSQATEAAFYSVPDRIRAMGRRATFGEVVVGLRSDSLHSGYHTVRLDLPPGYVEVEPPARSAGRRARAAGG
jgi:ATP-dependent Clp protease ATP-binding subunit ClpX